MSAADSGELHVVCGKVCIMCATRSNQFGFAGEGRGRLAAWWTVHEVRVC
jgi:hypothetical protein